MYYYCHPYSSSNGKATWAYVLIVIVPSGTRESSQRLEFKNQNLKPKKSNKLSAQSLVFQHCTSNSISRWHFVHMHAYHARVRGSTGGRGDARGSFGYMARTNSMLFFLHCCKNTKTRRRYEGSHDTSNVLCGGLEL